MKINKLNESMEHPYMFQYNCNNSTFGYDFQKYAQELGARRMYDHTQKGGGLHFYTVPSEDVYNKLKEVAKKRFTVDMYQLRPFDKERFANAKVQEAMVIGYDEDSIKEQIRILNKNIEDYQQLIVDEPEDKDYWEEQIKKCEEEIADLQSYKPLDEAADIGEEDFIEVEDPSIVDKLGFAGAVEMRGNKIYADANTLKQLKNEMDNLTEAKVFGAKANKLNEASYGGAFDIADDQYFTKEEIVEFGEDVVDSINNIGYSKVSFVSAYVENGCIEVTAEFDGGEATASTKIDMRKIRKPSDLYKACGKIIIDKLMKELTEIGADMGPHMSDQDYPMNEGNEILPVEELNSDGTSKQYDVKFMDLEKVPNILNWDIADKLSAYFRKHNLWVNELYYNESRDRIEYDIEWGDWKHEHLRSKWLLEELFKELGITAKIDSHTTEEDGSDTYSAHYNVYATK